MTRGTRAEEGFTLVELLAAIAVLGLVVVGVAYMLSTSRSFVDRFAVAREAMVRVEQRLETLQYPAAWTDTVPGTHVSALAPPLPGNIPATERLYVSYLDDPADGVAAADPNPHDYKQITVTVSWDLGAPDSVSLSSYFAAK